MPARADSRNTSAIHLFCLIGSARPAGKALREAVDRLKADEVDGAVLHHPDQLLADRIEELAAAC
ncbi:hypothetical protein ACIG3E_23460 [Streptomyces sp. NPDC053474]|uniref:hypothetical protein n=1 Tax=Streptomyces sp. NPDC053474 TaxID=3365704 RepID=UPI0037D4A85B